MYRAYLGNNKKFNKNNMTQLTYKIAHIKVGEEDSWAEVENSNDYKITITPDKSELIEIELRLDYCNHNVSILASNNYTHPLSTIANELGATIYGGFIDEKDFYLLLPVIDERKVGDIFVGEYGSFGKSKYCMLGFGQFKFCEDFHNRPSDSTYGFYWELSNDYDETYSFRASLLEGEPVFTNIFQEYARTGIIKNDFYKQFFK